MKKTFVLVIILTLLSACALSSCTPATPAPTPTPTTTPKPNPTETPTPTPSPTPIHPVGRIVSHEPDDFNPYYWFSYVPRTVSKDEPSYILITGIRAEMYDTYENLVHVARGEIERRVNLAEQNRFILIVPHIPRQDQPHIYTAAFSRLVFNNQIDPLFTRLDLKINLMIDEVIEDLLIDGYDIQTRVFLEGHSIGGLFSQRYALIHPERVQAIAAQIGGDLTLPVISYDGIELPWPIGIGDFSSLVGQEINVERYRQIPQYIYTGEFDIGSETPLIINYDGGPNSALWDMGWNAATAKYWIRFEYDNFGINNPTQTQNQVNYLNEIGFNNITFRLYPGIGHQQTEEMLEDILIFLNKKKD